VVDDKAKNFKTHQSIKGGKMEEKRKQHGEKERVAEDPTMGTKKYYSQGDEKSNGRRAAKRGKGSIEKRKRPPKKKDSQTRGPKKDGKEYRYCKTTKEETTEKNQGKS